METTSLTSGGQQQQCQIQIHEPHWENILLIDKDRLFDALIDIQLSIVTKSVRLCCPLVLLQFSNRTDLLHTSMTLLITLCHSYEEIRTKFIEHPKQSLWLKTLLLDTYDLILKREAQTSIYRLVMVSNNNSTNNNSSSGKEKDSKHFRRKKNSKNSLFKERVTI